MPGPVYAADPPGSSAALELEGLTALYHRCSGITHILAPPAPQILDALARGPADAAEIVRRIGEDFDVEGGEEALAARLAELEAAGLIRRE